MKSSTVMILSGAGLSAASGIKTFRDADGLWEEYDVMQVCSVQGWETDRGLVTRFYDERRMELADKEPNEAHRLFARLEREFPGRIRHFTQNVDDLLERAGCREAVHLHGTLNDLRCEACRHLWPAGYAPQEAHGHCPACGSDAVRHNVVMFGESAPEYRHLYAAAQDAALFIAVGTSGMVVDIVDLSNYAEASLLVDPVRRERVTAFGAFGQNVDEFFDRFIRKTAVDAMEEMERAIRDALA